MRTKRRSAFRRWGLAGVALGWMAWTAGASEAGETAVVIFNSAVPESKQVAEHYAEKRGVAAAQVLGLELPAGEVMSRTEYVERLQRPLLEKLEAGGLFVFGEKKDGPASAPQGARALTASKIRYAVLCYGMPIKIAQDEKLVEEA